MSHDIPDVDRITALEQQLAERDERIAALEFENRCYREPWLRHLPIHDRDLVRLLDLVTTTHPKIPRPRLALFPLQTTEVVITSNT
jgi:hypothetical protein